MRSNLLVAMALLALGTLPQCMRVTEGIEVDVAYQPAATPAAIRTDMGYQVRLDRALVSVGKVELIRCDNFVADLWQLVGPARAKAHALDTPTSLGVPLVIDLMESAGVPSYAGTMKPPPGRYCAIRILGMPADEDAEGLSDENLDMMQHSVLIAGRVEDIASGEQTALLTRIWELIECELELERPLEFGSPTLENVSIQIDQTSWFDGIDFALLDEDAVRERITENVGSSLRAALPLLEEEL